MPWTVKKAQAGGLRNEGGNSVGQVRMSTAVCTNSGSGSSSVFSPPMASPDSSCREVKVPHS